MAMRSLATSAAAALRRQPGGMGAGMPPAARSVFPGTTPSQNSNAIRRYSFDSEFARAELERSKKLEQAMRRGIKIVSGVVKVIKWGGYFLFTASIVSIVEPAINKP